MLSVLIPARNEIYLDKTIENVLANAHGNIEVIVALDGYLPDLPILKDPRVKTLHFPEPVGHRKATNELAKLAQGQFIMKLDAHCAVAPGFDLILAQDCEYDWTVIPRMYNLDIQKWEPKLFCDFSRAVRRRKVHDFLYIGLSERGELRSLYYPHDINKKLHHERKDILIDEAMSCMGPSFFMHRDRFWELDGCDEGHGIWGGQAVEVSLKAWLSGGKLIVNKKTWFAHWFRGGEGFPYPISGNQITRARDYCNDLWLNARWKKQVRPLSWLLDKFNPPGRERFNAIQTQENTA